MTTEVSAATACFVDHGGLYLPLALKLAESYKRVIYTDPNESAFPKVDKYIIGDGFKNLERVGSFWPLKSEIDLFIFPDSQGFEVQAELISQGYQVWGSGRAQSLEQSREKFHRVLGEVGLKVPKFIRVVGITALTECLLDAEDKYIKISKYRGSLETFHWHTWEQDKDILALWTVRFGGVAELIPFLVFDAIDTDLEIGADTYSVNGEFPTHMLDGTEWKDKGYFAAFKPVEEMPEQTQKVLQAFGPVLSDHGHKNFWSMEIRVTETEFYFIDATPRAPLPGMASQMELYGNLPEIILAGAHGELVNPDPLGQFAVECILSLKGEKEMWSNVVVPEELQQWVKLGGACMVKGRTWFPPDDSHGPEVGWLVAIGDTPTETIKTLLDRAKSLPDGMSAAVESLADILKEIESAKEQGIEMTDQKLPDPSIVVEEHAESSKA